MNFKGFTLTICVIIICYIFLYTQNNSIVVTKIELSVKNLPKGFDGYSIVQISDLQNKVFGKDNSVLISKIRNEKPDLVVITGDLIGSNKYNEKSILNFIDAIKVIAPIYYVTGNHEMSKNYMLKLEPKLKDNNIRVLRNTSEIIKRNGDSITIIGIDDPVETQESENYFTSKVVSQELDESLIKSKVPNFKVLLSHRPEFFSLYSKSNMDLTFSGHAHGGQVRLPFIGGLYAPGQGFFPKYTSGKYDMNNSIMIVSRGLGNSSIPQRILNRPEIIIAILYKK